MDKTHCVVIADRAGCSWTYAEGSEDWCEGAYYRAARDWKGRDYFVTVCLTEPNE